MATKRRYPGTPPFQEQDANIFFGRGQDTQDLLELIQLKELVVLYGKSGLGKTSLLNAGIIPALGNINQEAAEEGDGMMYEAMKVRFFAWKDENSQSPVETLRNETVASVPQHPLLSKAGVTTDSLWYRFKSHQLEQTAPTTYILFFDQFEELFTYPSEQVKDFKQALAHLLNAHIPADLKQNLRERFRTDKALFNREEKQRLLQPISLKVVLAIRSDRLSLLDKMSDYLPNILVNLYELKALNSLQARAAIALPAAQEGDFDTSPFQYSAAALSAILSHLSGEHDRIEPFQIQYVCEHAEQVVQQTKKTVLEQSDLGDLSTLFENYYHLKIAEIGNAAEERKARHLLEDGLLFNGVRLSLLKEQIVSAQGFGLSRALLRQLEDVRLLRAEGRGEQVYYEITHDTLVGPIVKAQEVRKAKERRRRLLGLGGLGLLALLITVASFWGVYSLYQNALVNEEKAILNEQKASNALKEVQAKNALIEQQKDSLSSAFGALTEALLVADSAKAEALLQQGFAERSVAQFKKSFAIYLMSEAKKTFEVDNPRLTLRLVQEALKFYPDNLEAQDILDNIPLFLASTYQNYSSKINTSQFSKNGKHLSFYTDVKGGQGILHILNLETYSDKTFPNCYRYNNTYNKSYKYSYSSDSKHLLFYTDVKDGQGTLHILNLETYSDKTFPNSYSYSDRDRYRYSPDSKHLLFYTDVEYRQATLHILNLDTYSDKTFPNCDGYRYSDSDHYSSDSKHLLFYTDVKYSQATLHVLNLETYSDKTFPNSDRYRYHYSSDSEHLLFYTDVKNRQATLHVLNLETYSDKTFPNSDRDSDHYRYSSDSKHLSFYTDVDVKDGQGILHILNLETYSDKTFPNIDTACNEHRYSSDSKHLLFHTFTKNNPATLHVLNLETYSDKTFPNSYCYGFHYRYSSDSKHLLFYTDVEDNQGTLHVLNLETYSDKTFPNSHCNEHGYSSDSKHLLFNTGEKYRQDTLHILNLETYSDHSFPNTYSYIPRYNYSSDSKHLSFYTNVKYEQGTLHILNLETYSDYSFPNSYRNRNRYSSDSKKLAFLKNQGKTLTVIQLQNMQAIKTIQHQTKITDFHFSKDSRCLISTSKYPGSQNGVLKITDLHIEGDLLEYYDDFYAPLTKAERERYGLE